MGGGGGSDEPPSHYISIMIIMVLFGYYGIMRSIFFSNTKGIFFFAQQCGGWGWGSNVRGGVDPRQAFRTGLLKQNPLAPHRNPSFGVSIGEKLGMA